MQNVGFFPTLIGPLMLGLWSRPQYRPRRLNAGRFLQILFRSMDLIQIDIRLGNLPLPFTLYRINEDQTILPLGGRVTLPGGSTVFPQSLFSTGHL
jgi:hypothetical protein